MNEDPLQPRLESVRFPQARKILPYANEGVLNRIVRHIGVAHDQLRRAVEPIHVELHEKFEGGCIALARVIDEARLSGHIPDSLLHITITASRGGLGVQTQNPQRIATSFERRCMLTSPRARDKSDPREVIKLKENGMHLQARAGHLIRRQAIVALLSSTVLVACATTGGGSPSADEASSTPTVAPSVAAAAELCPPGLETDQSVEPGSYVASNLDPSLSITVPEGEWTVGCADETFALFHTDSTGSLAVIGDVRMLGRGGDPQPIDATPEALIAAMTERDVVFSEPTVVEVAGAEGLETTVTADEAGVGFRNEHERGWGFSDAEGDAIVTAVAAGDTLLVFVRHGDDAALADIMASATLGE